MGDVARGLRDDLAAAFDEETKASATAEPVETPVEVEAPEVAETPEAPTGDRLRGPDGKFLAKDKAEETAEVAPKEKPEPEAAAQPEKPAAPAKGADPIATATARWSAADKAALAKLPPEAQQFLVRRHTEMEADYTKKTQASAEFRKEYEPVEQMFAPFKQQMQQMGHSPSTLIKAWANAEQELIQGRGVEFLTKVVKDYRIDPAALAKALGVTQAPAPQPASAAQPNAPPIQLDPDVQRLLQAHLGPLLEPLQKQVGEVVGFTQQQRDTLARQQQAELNRQTQSANQTVQQFIDAVGKDGQPLHPHYAEVESLMVVFAQAERNQGRTPDLERIYDQAVYATPSTREKLLAAQSAAQEATRTAEARAKATAARSAAVSVSGAPTGGPAPRGKKEPQSIRDALLEAAAESEDAA